jgi:F-box/leucine-rich repeat protein 14
VKSIAKLSQLESLDISHCDKITDVGIRAIASLSQLEILNISHCDKITDVGMGYIANGLYQLKTLNMDFELEEDESIETLNYQIQKIGNIPNCITF